MVVEIDKIYQSELIANTDIHAGGLFFCIVYLKCLTFKNNGQVILTNKIIDPFRPMDPADIKHIENYKILGNYYTNDRGYLTCEFAEIFTRQTGMFLVKKTDSIVFHVFDSRLNKQWSEIYTTAS